MRGLLAERHDPLLAALAAHVEELLLEVDVAEVEPDGLGAAQAGRVDELDERAVAEPERAVAARSAVEQRVDLGGLRRVGSRRARFGASETSGTCAGPSAKRSSERTAESFRAIVAGASFAGRRGRARRRSRASTRTSTSSSRPRSPSQPANCSQVGRGTARRVASENAG